MSSLFLKCCVLLIENLAIKLRFQKQLKALKKKQEYPCFVDTEVEPFLGASLNTWYEI